MKKESPESPQEQQSAAAPPAAANENATPAVPENEAALLERIAKLEEEIAQIKDQRMRALAETDNTRKRAQRDLEETSKYAVTGFARDMVTVLENLNRAAEALNSHAGSEDVIKTLGEGIKLTLNELLAIFEKYQIRRIDPMGQKFDHNFHQAVVQVERDDVPPGTVVQVVQAGYVIHDRLLRPAMVAVSKQGEAPKAVYTTA